MLFPLLLSVFFAIVNSPGPKKQTFFEFISAAKNRSVIFTLRKCQKPQLVLFFVEVETHYAGKIQCAIFCLDQNRQPFTCGEPLGWKNNHFLPRIESFHFRKFTEVILIFIDIRSVNSLSTGLISSIFFSRGSFLLVSIVR